MVVRKTHRELKFDNVRNNRCDLSDYNVRHELARFILFMYKRGFNTRENTRRAATTLLEKALDFQMGEEGESFDCKVRLTKEGEAMWHRILIEDDPREADYLTKKDFFHIYCIRKDREVSWKTSFYTSDNPVHLESMIDTGPYGIGLLMPGVIFTMPLAHDVYAVMGDADYRKELGYDDMYEITFLYTSDEEESNGTIKFLNMKTACASMKMVFSRDSNMTVVRMISKERIDCGY